jgi:hypothetical protein
MHHVGLELANQAVELPDGDDIPYWMEGAPKFGDDDRENAVPLGIILHVAFARLDMAADQQALIIRRAKLMRQQGNVNRRAADIQAGDDTEYAGGAGTTHGESNSIRIEIGLKFIFGDVFAGFTIDVVKRANWNWLVAMHSNEQTLFLSIRGYFL